MRYVRAIRPAAQADIDEHADYLAEQGGEGLGYRFILAVEEVMDVLLEWPEAGAPWQSDHPRLQGIRRYRVIDFTNHYIYRVRTDALEVIHLYHAKQDIEHLLASEADAEGEPL